MLYECWLFIGATNDDGYGVAGVDGKIKYVHRASYEVLVGPIPEELELDHLCRVRNCYNPYHLEAVTHEENCRRKEVERLTHCKRGHERNEENAIHLKTGYIGCRACNRIRYKKWYYNNWA